MDYDLINRRDELSRDNQLRRELDEATPSIGAASLVVGGLILLILGVVYLGPPASDTTTVETRAAMEMAAPMPAPTNP